jgi:hypothetical protein
MGIPVTISVLKATRPRGSTPLLASMKLSHIFTDIANVADRFREGISRLDYSP